MRQVRNTSAWVAAAIGIGVAVYAVLHFSPHDTDSARCGAGFFAKGSRCLAIVVGGACPAPLVLTPIGCDAPVAGAGSRVSIPAASVLVGPSDWEAEGRVAPRVIHADAFAIDALEITVGAAFCPNCPIADPARFTADAPSRAASPLTRGEARTICKSRGGRLPHEDEWVVAASANVPVGPGDASESNGGATARAGRRYPWGDTGLVCRRAAWGLATGPCADVGKGADTVGAHPDGNTPLGLYDVAGNVAEWVETDGDAGIARGGSWSSALASELRVWSRQEAEPSALDPRIGVRCAYDLPRERDEP